jgi:two-component system C4-dicarboxylate transport sensor histidine kinase DctB
MVDPSIQDDPSEQRLAGVIAALIQVASGNFEARLARDGSGDDWDVLSYLVNATIDEVSDMVSELQEQREAIAVAHEHLARASKLAALGELAGGVAHELNQPLTAIRMAVDLCRLPDADVSEPLSLIASSADHMARIIDNVRVFARQHPLHMAMTPARAPLDAAIGLMRPDLELCGITLLLQCDDVPPLSADADRLQQVLVNLLRNARDAVSATPSTIRIGLHDEPDHVAFVVEDDGPGVPDAIRHRIFDPFFTTKDVDAGSGLGLSVSHAIVTQHQGSLQYERGEHGGARFVMRIPKDPKR